MPNFFTSGAVKDKENSKVGIRASEEESEHDLEVAFHAAASTPPTSNQNNQNNLNTDRFIAPRGSIESLNLASARLAGSFDTPLTAYRNGLTTTLFNQSFTDLSRSSVRDPSKIFGAQKRTMRMPYHIVSGAIKDAPDVTQNPNYSVLCRNGYKLFIALGADIYSYHPATDSIGSFTPGSNQTITALACDERWLLHSTRDALCVYNAENNALATTIRSTVQFNTIVADYNRGFYLSSNEDGAVAHYDIRSPRIERLGVRDNLISMSYQSASSTVAMSFEDPALVKLYDVRQLMRAKLELPHHQKCSRVMAFSPFEGGRLMTAGGANTNSLFLWNTVSGSLLAQGKSESALTGVHWLDEHTMIVTKGTHLSTWFVENEQILLESESKAKHLNPILTSAQNPRDRGDLVTVGVDDLLRFWTVKKQPQLNKNENESRAKRARPEGLTLTIR